MNFTTMSSRGGRQAQSEFKKVRRRTSAMIVGNINHEDVQALGIFDKENNKRPQKEDANTGRGSSSSSSDNEED